mgnify:CR=1 FL=1
MDYRKSYRIYRIAVWVFLVLVLFASLAEILWMGIAGIVIMVLGMGQTVFFCKCKKIFFPASFISCYQKHNYFCLIIFIQIIFVFLSALFTLPVCPSSV